MSYVLCHAARVKFVRLAIRVRSLSTTKSVLSALSVVHKCFAFYVLCYESLFEIRFLFVVLSSLSATNAKHNTQNAQRSAVPTFPHAETTFVLICAIRVLFCPPQNPRYPRYPWFYFFLPAFVRTHVSVPGNKICVNLGYQCSNIKTTDLTSRIKLRPLGFQEATFVSYS